MLLLLLPEQIPQYWDDIKEGLSRALPPGPIDRKAKLLAGLQVGKIQCWISYQKTEKETLVDGVVITALVDDQVHGLRNLLIYALWNIDEVHSSTWIEGFEALRKFAISKGCSRIVAYTDDSMLIDLAKGTLNGEAQYTFLTWDL